METINFNLSNKQFNHLNKKYRKGHKSSAIGKRAVEIVKFYFLDKYPDCGFRVPNDGCDLEVLPNNIKLEVKGTSSDDIAWSQLKVSGNPSYNQLLNDLPLYRVSNVYEKVVTINIMKHSDDFIMEQKPRWAIKKKEINKND